MGIATVLGYVLQLVQAGFVLSEIVANVKAMKADGVSDNEIRKYLRDLAHKAQDDLENA